ncbi:MAG TPA: DUF1579 domain-containing protein [Planctomycetota bacterium]|nr:DUF1579 domain-containing protein [Planctomycetota bacterium]
MKPVVIASILAALVSGAVSAPVQSPVPKPKATKEHDWLRQLEGEWSFESEWRLVPGAPPVKWTATSKTRQVGDVWIVSDYEGEMGGVPMSGVLILGYDPDQKAIVGSWVDSTCTHLYRYVGALDEAKNTLTLDTEGPFVINLLPGKTIHYRDVLEIKSKDRWTYTSSMRIEDGEWMTLGKAASRRIR